MASSMPPGWFSPQSGRLAPGHERAVVTGRLWPIGCARPAGLVIMRSNQKPRARQGCNTSTV